MVRCAHRVRDKDHCDRDCSGEEGFWIDSDNRASVKAKPPHAKPLHADSLAAFAVHGLQHDSVRFGNRSPNQSATVRSVCALVRGVTKPSAYFGADESR